MASNNTRLRLRWPIVAVALFGLVLIVVATAAIPFKQTTPSGIYWGALIKGNTYGLSDAPWNTDTIDIFESHTQKKPAIMHWGQPWWFCYSRCDYQPFTDQQKQFDLARSRGYIPLIDWASWDYSVDPQHDQPRFALRTIIDGEHDAFIRQWAEQARDWGHPFFLRFNWEMNGDWYPWSEKANGNKSGEFVQAWRHVHNIFREVGANNVTWVWCPVTSYAGGIPLDKVYPGDDYVDWTCMDGYNRGTNPSRSDRWKTFSEVFKPTYQRLLEIAPSRPIMIGEFASSEYGGSKAAWISDALETQLPTFFPQIKAAVWFNWNANEMDWVIETSPEAQAAFAQGIGSSYYVDNRFTDLDQAPIPPYDELRPFWQRWFCQQNC